uniref:Uncharacterized protein n=1 Tax=Physcomitrium patens TaxID=3218 RepID=A0A2K1IY27_PHYPA|nr:hypothetical protein PHYPA_024006 [Physcomitrium patens]
MRLFNTGEIQNMCIVYFAYNTGEIQNSLLVLTIGKLQSLRVRNFNILLTQRTPLVVLHYSKRRKYLRRNKEMLYFLTDNTCSRREGHAIPVRKFFQAGHDIFSISRSC